MYYAMMRPSEMAALTAAGCHLPEIGWGYLIFADSSPAAGKAYTDDGQVHEHCGLKGLATAEASLRPAALPRHLASTSFNSGVPATEVAAWAGHSVEVLMRIYARCMTGLEDVWISRMDGTLHLEDGGEGDRRGRVSDAETGIWWRRLASDGGACL